MKKIVSLLFILFVAVQYQAQTTVEMVTHNNIDTSIKVVAFDDLEGLYYASEHPSLKITFDTHFTIIIFTLTGKTQVYFRIVIFTWKT